jgi:peroxiredoxin
LRWYDHLEIWLIIVIISINLFSQAKGSDLSLYESIQTPRIRKEAPNFTLETLKGNQVTLNNYRGKVVLLHFWATWCKPCMEELPTLQKLWESMEKKGFMLLAIAIDRTGKKQVEDYIERFHYTFPVLLDPEGKVRNSYLVQGIPTTYLIGKDGKFSGVAIGARNWISQEIKSILGEMVRRE